MKEKLWLSEAMVEFNKKFKNKTFNILNSYAGSGKTSFIFGDFLENTYKYVTSKNKKLKYKNNLDRVLYVCDTTMLKESVLKNTNGLTKILETGDIKRAIKDKTLKQIVSGDTGKIKVITYNTLGFLLNEEKCRNIIVNCFDCIIMDEIHNLFKYAYRFKDGKNNFYNVVLSQLPIIVHQSNILCIGMTATPYTMYYPLSQLNMSYTTIFKDNELKRIRKYKDAHEQIFKHCVNIIKLIAVNKDYLIEHNQKVLIYTNTKSMAEKYKQILINGGLNAEYLCSINNNKMTEKQLQLREKLLNDGLYPKELNCLIINSSMETGWNVRDENVKLVVLDTINYTTQVQARNRIRHDIEWLFHKEIVDNDGFWYERDIYKNEYIQSETYIVNLVRFIPEEYLNRKLTKDEVNYLVQTYATVHNDKVTCNRQTFKIDLQEAGYKMIVNSKGTFILKAEDDFKEIYEEIKAKEKEKKKMNNNDELIKYLDSIIENKLYRKEQNELIEIINLKVNGRLQKSYRKLNQGLEMLKLPYIIIPKKSNSVRYWIIEKIEE